VIVAEFCVFVVGLVYISKVSYFCLFLSVRPKLADKCWYCQSFSQVLLTSMPNKQPNKQYVTGQLCEQTVVIVVRYGYYCPCTVEFCAVTAAHKWLDPVLAI